MQSIALAGIPVPNQVALWFTIWQRGKRFVEPFDLASYVAATRAALPRPEAAVINGDISYAESFNLERDRRPLLPAFCGNCGTPVPGSAVPGGLIMLQCSHCTDPTAPPIHHNSYLAQIVLLTGYPYQLIAYWFAAYLTEHTKP